MSESLKANLLLTAFILLVVDRVFVLYAIKNKAESALARSITPSRVFKEKWVLEKFVEEFPTVIMFVILMGFSIVGGMHVIQPETLSNDIGRAALAALGFILSTGGTMLGLCADRL